MAAGAAVLAAAAWLREPSVPYLAAAVVATVAVAGLAIRAGGPGRRWRVATALVAALFCAVVAPSQATLSRVATDWESHEQRLLDAAAADLRAGLAAAVRDTRAAAALALEVPDGDAVFDALAPVATASVERAVVLLSGDSALAWAGTVRVPLQAVPPGLGFVRTPFYDLLTVRDTARGRRAVATLLLEARPPADGLAHSLAADLVGRATTPSVHFDLAPADGAVGDASLRLDGGGRLVARLDPLVRDEVEFRVRERARLSGILLLGLLAACVLGSVWGRTLGLGHRLAALAALLGAVAIVPLNALSNASALFDPSYYFAAVGGPFTASVGALLLTSAISLLALLAVLRARRPGRSRILAAGLAVAVAGLGPFLLRDLARGIVAPPRGGTTSLWLAWHVGLFLAATVVLLLGASAGRAALGRRRGLPPMLAPAVAAAAALLAQPLLGADGRWPPWYPALWIAAIAALAFTRRTRLIVLSAAAIASLGAMTLVWGSTVRWRQQLAEGDVAGLTRVDPVISTLLERLASELAADEPPETRAELLAAYAASDLAAADHAVQLTAWSPAGTRVAEVTDVGGEGLAELRALADRARAAGETLQEPIATARGVRMAVAVPAVDGQVTTVAVAQRTRLLPDDPYAPLFVGGTGESAAPPYEVALAPATAAARAGGAEATLRWTRRGDALHGDWTALLADEPATVHVELELRSLAALAQRGALLLLLDLLVVGTLWMLDALAERGLPRWLRASRRQWSRSYRARLSLALFAFFAVPAVAFGVWTSRQLQSDYRRSRELLVSEALRVVVARAAADSAVVGDSLARLAWGDAPLLVYRGNVLAAASDELLATLAPLGRLLPPAVAVGVSGSGHLAASHVAPVGDAQVLVGYRALPAAASGAVLAVPARADDLGLDARRRDLGVLVLLATALGALAALWLSGFAARQLARPIGQLRAAALAVAAGEREPPLRGAEPPAEFVPVFSAFRRMATDLATSREALEAANRRTAAVLRNVASAVVAVDDAGVVTLHNPAAERLFGPGLAAGAPLAALGVPALERRVAQLATPAGEAGEPGDEPAGDDEAEVELELGRRQVLGRVTPLASGGAVLTLDDVTELARAQRVLAWGEMARQVAHEIKNPLTPIRLGVQHLRRAYQSGRGDYERVLGQNVERILAEIDRLDEIARAFSRYGTAPDERRAGEPTDVAAVVRDVVELERLGAADSPVAWHLAGADAPRLALAREDELREVLLNVLENARLAGAREVRVELSDGGRGNGDGAADALVVAVHDDGGGIPAAVLGRVFEPHFSTRTSGSGLGLAISRRLVEGWGGTIALRSAEGEGTEVRITLAAVPR